MKRQYQPSKIRRKRQHGFLARNCEEERAGDPAQSAPGRAQAADARIRGRRMAAQTPPRLRFARTARIKQARDFVRVRQAGERMVLGCLIANWQRLPAGARVAPGGRHRGPDRLRRGAQSRPAAPAGNVPPPSVRPGGARGPGAGGAPIHRRKGLCGGGEGLPDHAAEGEIVKAGWRRSPVNAAQHILIFGVRCYRYVLSPAKSLVFGPLGRCRFTPSCSEYALAALRRPRRPGRELAGPEAHRPLSSVGWLRP